MAARSLVIACCLGAALVTTDAFAQSVAPAAAEASAKRFERLRFLDFITTEETGAAGTGTGPAHTSLGIYLRSGVTSAASKYTFPLAVGFNPFQRLAAAAPANPVTNAFAGSVLEVSYAPLFLRQEARPDVPGATHVVGHATQAISGSYTVQLKDLDSLELQPQQDSLLHRGGQPIADAEEAWRQALHGLSITGTAAYTGTWDDSKQDQFVASTTLSKALPTLTPVPLDGGVGWTVFPSKNQLRSYTGVLFSAGARFVLRDDIELRAQVGATHFLGDGFHGIDGVFDKQYRTDVTVAEVVTFTIKKNQPLKLSFKETHLGSGSADFAVTTDFAYKFDQFKLPGR